MQKENHNNEVVEIYDEYVSDISLYCNQGTAHKNALKSLSRRSFKSVLSSVKNATISRINKINVNAKTNKRKVSSYYDNPWGMTLSQ